MAWWDNALGGALGGIAVVAVSEGARLIYRRNRRRDIVATLERQTGSTWELAWTAKKRPVRLEIFVQQPGGINQPVEAHLMATNLLGQPSQPIELQPETSVTIRWIANDTQRTAQVNIRDGEDHYDIRGRRGARAK